MHGQWLGRYKDSMGGAGTLMVNVDEVHDHYEGVAYVYPNLQTLPVSVAYFSTSGKQKTESLEAIVSPIDPNTGRVGVWDEIRSFYPSDTVHSSKAHVDLDLVNFDSLVIKASTDVGIHLDASLKRSSIGETSKISGEKMDWSQFKTHVTKYSGSSYLFRGQEKPWRLCTSFHRRERYRISEFIRRDVQQLHQRLSAITNHYFDLDVPNQNGAFFNLLQHHGYPTPLLDWSHSPYVAAFFGFRSYPIGYEGGGVVRIYIFNNDGWQNSFPQIQNLDPPFPHLSVMEFFAIGNPRLVPQQSVTTVTNLADIEAYVQTKERDTGLRFLEAIDIPANERDLAMSDLRYMGITAGAMFPGIDGVCEEMRERNFHT